MSVSLPGPESKSVPLPGRPALDEGRVYRVEHSFDGGIYFSHSMTAQEWTTLEEAKGHARRFLKVYPFSQNRALRMRIITFTPGIVAEFSDDQYLL